MTSPAQGDPADEEVRFVEPPDPPPRVRRANYIGAPQFFRLNEACRIINDAFDFGYGVYLVGSSLVRRDYRDVDLRCIVSDEDYARLFPGIGAGPWRHPFWSLLCSSISLYLSQTSGLPIDFQIQSMTEANRDYPSPEHQRNALGLFFRAKPSEAT